MEHLYQLEGMTCKGCMRIVKTALENVDGVNNVDIDFDASTAVIAMEKHIPVEKLESAVQAKKSKYHIRPYNNSGKINHTYHIHGMTCNGCRNHVEETLSKVKGVSSAKVDLDKAEATIEMEIHISIDTLQKAL
ncbi:MAG: heavy metal-associated domain-containing protein, partial [Vicingaceae bacterium]